LIDSVEKELNAVQRATEKWDAHWKSLQTVIEKYESLYQLTGIEIDKVKTPDVPEGPEDTTDENDTTGGAVPVNTEDTTGGNTTGGNDTDGDDTGGNTGGFPL
jgi:hypothetical protein